MKKKTVTPLEVSEILGVSLTSVYRWIKSGELPSISLGRKKIILLKRLEALLNEGDNAKDTE